MNNNAKSRLNTLVKEHGPKLVVYIVLMDVLDDVLLPTILAFAGYPMLSATTFISDLDWLTFPLYFVFATAMNRIKYVFRKQ